MVNEPDITQCTITFGLRLDDVTFPAPNTEGGQYRFGPKGLLRFLEGHLGLEGHVNRVEHIRTEQYRQALTLYVQSNPDAFFANSFDADQLACAEAMLARRDELLLSGWDFDLKDTDLPSRLLVLGNIEKNLTDGKKLISGFADRFEAILQALSDKTIPVSTILVRESIRFLPPQYKRLFSILEHKNTDVKSISNAHKTTDEIDDSDLNIFKLFVANKKSKTEKTPFKGDGSLVIIKAERDTDAANYVAKVLNLNENFKPVFLIPDRSRTLDDAFIHNSLPSFGLPSASLGRPTLQLLKLVTTFIWRPIDPFKILEFVTLAAKPLDADLSNVIAKCISERPGVGGDQWFFETERFFENLTEKALLDSSINVPKIRREYEFWFDRTTYDVTKSAPKDEIAEIFTKLKDWASEEFENNGSKNTSLLVLSEQARRIEEFLEELPPNEKFLTFLELERIIRTIYEPSPVQPSPRELGHFPFVHHESCLLDSVDTLLWWNFTDTEGVHFFARWYKEEFNYLKNKNIQPQTPQDENALMLWERSLPIFLTNEKLILLHPKKANGKETVEHPMMSHLLACFDDIEANIVQIEGHTAVLTENKGKKVLQNLLELPQSETLTHYRLGKTPLFLTVDSQKLKAREQETLSSLETFFYYPYQWVFRHKAKLSKSSILSIAKENTLKGNLSHRFFELILKEDFQNWTREQVNDWIDERKTRLMQREAATLMMYGYEPDRVQFISQVKYAVWTLICHIRSNNWKVQGTEIELRGQFCAIPVKGKADIVLERGSELCVLDLKWSGHGYRERLIKNREDLQLVMYSRLLTEDLDWANTAYFVIEKPILLSKNNEAFKEIKALLPDVKAAEANEKTWQDMEKTYHWRLAQITEGRIEIRTEKTTPELEEIYGAELQDVLEMKKEDAKFDDYRTLIGLVI